MKINLPDIVIQPGWTIPGQVKKIGEESIEIILAATAQEKSQIVYEIADLLYHVLVLMFEKEVSLKEVMNELKSRHK